MSFKSVLFAALLLGAPAPVLANVTCHAIFISDTDASIAPANPLIQTSLYPYNDPAAQLRSFVGTGLPAGETPSIKLGEGSYGSVFLESLDQDGQSLRIRKIYVRSEKAANRATADMLSLGALSDLSSEARVTGFDFLQGTVSLSFDEAGKAPTATFIGPYVPGRTVHELLLSAETAKPIKEKIESIYMENLTLLLTALKDSGALEGPATVGIPETMYFKDRKIDDLPAIFGKIRLGNQIIDFIIKSDNVIVDPYDLKKQTLIDPY